MKQFISKKILVLLVLALSLGSVPAFAGGEHFTIYLNKKMVLQQSVLDPINVVNLLGQANSNDQLVIHYSHCGQVGKDRHVMLKNESGQTVKQWDFEDGKEGMSIPAGEIAALQKKHGQLTLSYSSKELPKGRALASLKGTGKNLACLLPATTAPLKWLTI
jgi:hypothetical protein